MSFKEKLNELVSRYNSFNVRKLYDYFGLEVSTFNLRLIKKENGILVYGNDNCMGRLQNDNNENIFDEEGPDEVRGAEWTMGPEVFAQKWDLVNDYDSNRVFIPCYVTSKECFYVVVTDLSQLKTLLQVEDASNWKHDFINDFPVLYFKLKHGLYEDYHEDHEHAWHFCIGYGTASESVKIINNILQYYHLSCLELIQALANTIKKGVWIDGVIDIAMPGTEADLKIPFEDKAVLDLTQIKVLRKYLQMSNPDVHIVAKRYDGCDIVNQVWIFEGVGKCEEKLARIQFFGNSKWKLIFAKDEIYFDGVKYYLRCRNITELCKIEFEKVMAIIKEEHAEKVRHMIKKLQVCGKNSILVFASNARDEARRLGKLHRAIRVTPFKLYELDEDEITALAKLEGCILMDETATCHAIGVKLDGDAGVRMNPLKGTEYNAVITYLSNVPKEIVQMAAVIISENGEIQIVDSNDVPNADNDLYQKIQDFEKKYMHVDSAAPLSVHEKIEPPPIVKLEDSGVIEVSFEIPQ